MAFSDPPPLAAWRHCDSRDGFEVVFIRPLDAGGYLVEGHTTAMETGVAWAIDYAITIDAGWVTRGARIRGQSSFGRREIDVWGDGAGNWTVDGGSAPQVAGCLDIDLEASAFTNALPVHRFGLKPGERSQAPAAWVRAADLTIERLEQNYRRIDNGGEQQHFAYEAPALQFTAELTYDSSGLVLDYPGIAKREA